MNVPHNLRRFDLSGFSEWISKNGGSLEPSNNEYEVIRYKMWTPEDKSRPSTHIVYRRKNDSLTYQGKTLKHYEEFIK